MGERPAFISFFAPSSLKLHALCLGPGLPVFMCSEADSSHDHAVAYAFVCGLFFRPVFTSGVSHDQHLAVCVITTVGSGGSPRGLQVFGDACLFSSGLVSSFLLLVFLLRYFLDHLFCFFEDVLLP